VFIERLLNQGNAPLLEQQLKFAAARHRLIAENIANVSTPGYRQKDLDQSGFEKALRERVETRRGASPGSVRFDDIRFEPITPGAYATYHDGGNRSKEQLMSELSKNGLRHNMYAELLRRAYGSIQNALRERVT
jgi:flagellar basal-body rod protein FlgB